MKPKDLRSGMKFGRLTAIKEVGKNHGHITWECKCDCGNTTIVSRDRLIKGITQSCGCLKHQKSVNLKDMVGKHFGKLLVLEKACNTPQGQAMWLCQCDCGNITTVRGADLRGGKTVSCGCFALISRTKHGGSKERLYSIWRSMKDRCNNFHNENYKNYGGIGVKVCHEWEDYSTFREWAFLNGYNEKAEYGECSIDRINVDGDYAPDNCRWVTMQEQQMNKHTNVFIDKDGKRQTLTEWCRELNLNESAIRNRYRNGWSIDRLFEPIKTRKKA